MCKRKNAHIKRVAQVRTVKTGRAKSPIRRSDGDNQEDRVTFYIQIKNRTKQTINRINGVTNVDHKKGGREGRKNTIWRDYP